MAAFNQGDIVRVDNPNGPGTLKAKIRVRHGKSTLCRHCDKVIFTIDLYAVDGDGRGYCLECVR